MSPVLLVLAGLVLVNVWVHLGPRRTHVLTGPLFAVVLLALGRWAGLSWAGLGLSPADMVAGALYGAAAAALAAAAVAVACAVPLTRRAFLDRRYRVPLRRAVRISLVTIPLATVVLEEVAFRSVLWGLLDREHGAGVATVLSSALFGLWHVLPALDLVRTNSALEQRGAARGRRAVLTVLGTVAFTAVAGVVFAELRRASGSLLAPVALHWATNGLAVVAAARVWAVTDSLTSPGRAETSPG